MSYVLERNDTVRMPRGLLRLVLTGAAGAAGHLEVVGADGARVAASAKRPDVVVVTGLEGTATVRATAADGTTFPPGTTLGLELTVGSRADEGEAVRLRSVEVSGEAARGLVRLHGGATAADVVVEALDIVRAAPLGELASAARSAARRLTGRGARTAYDVVVAVDLSASMAPAIHDGSLRAVVDVLAGVAQVVGVDRGLTVCLVGQRTRQLPATPAAGLAEATAAAVRETGLGAGFRAAAAGLPAGRGTLTYVLTDDVPADVDVLLGLRATGDLRRLVLLGHDEPVRAGRGARGVPLAVLPAPPAGQDTSAFLLADRGVLADLVGGMIEDGPA